jgi:hypothetical protein
MFISLHDFVMINYIKELFPVMIADRYLFAFDSDHVFPDEINFVEGYDIASVNPYKIC